MVETDKHDHIGGSWGILSNRLKDEVVMSERTPDCCARDECPI